MHPNSVPCLNAFGVDCCVLANKHVLDWGYLGLQETISALQNAEIKTSGAGENLTKAQASAIFELPTGKRVLIFGFGTTSGGIPDQECIFSQISQREPLMRSKDWSKTSGKRAI